MQTGGHNNDGLMVVVPVGVSLVLGMIMFGGPTETLRALDALIRETVYQVTMLVSALL